MYNDLRLQKIADKAGLSLDNGIRIILAEHMLKHLVPKKDLTTIRVDLDNKTDTRLNRIAKTLKVSKAAVMMALLEAQIEKISKKA